MTVAEAARRLTPLLLTGAPLHPDYARTVQLATEYRRFATGKDLAQEMQRFAARETPEQYQSRVRMTVFTAPAAWNQARTPFYEMARLRGGSITRRLDYAPDVAPTEAARRTARLTAAIDAYHNQGPIERYLAEKLTKSHCMSDPNAWLLTEFAPFDFRTQTARPYPVLVPCEAVMDFTRAAGTVTSFTARLAIAGLPAAYRYTCYLDTQAVDCWPVVYERPGADAPALYTLPEGSVLAGEVIDEEAGRVVYQYRVLPHGAGLVPARPLGYVVDEEGTGETFVSPLHAGLPFLRQMLKVGSENDIVMSQMAIPIRLAYARDCPGAGKDAAGQEHNCRAGIDSVTWGPCTVCGGQGTLPVPITAAETVTMPMPKIGDDPKVKPADLLAFAGPATDNPKLQLDYLESRRLLFMQAIHGTESEPRVAGQDTATQSRLQREAQKTALAPAADQFAALYVHAATVAAGYTDTQQGLAVVYEFPPDLELTSEDDLYVQRKAAVDAKADASTLEAIDARIAGKQFADDPAALTKNQVKRRFITFLGYSDAVVLQMASLGYISPADRVARTHADIIFGELEAEHPDFYSLSYKEAQVPLVAAKVAEILAKLPSAAAGTGAFKPLNLNPVTTGVAV